MKNATTTPATRPTKVAKTPRAEAEALMTRYAALSKASADILEEAKKAAAPKLDEMADLKEKLQAWSEKHPNEFGGHKMLSVEAGVFGFKAGVKSVAFPDPETAPKDIQAKYLKLVRAELPAAIIEKVDSGAVVKAWGLVPALCKGLEKLGISIKQPDNFIVTAKK
ncbi:Bacteriophage Mu Gam like protein [Hymenobacter daecheongensis DSM 21074]|uniref:Bacteriophage Mu Gam like protein n=1 Tax=Hymenobacter daecheongensis DSM 21074 TaxID=1121955 RepID=A0A1M6LVU1_9BACT|nr:host-nuclease inhibitor Gam family protein [Hymenobacter daecheongensis]SHJ75282.1 Bacteriophage Mu Gam like protein [Hymenobacter daecheongensis DSM 21074]